MNDQVKAIDDKLKTAGNIAELEESLLKREDELDKREETIKQGEMALIETQIRLGCEQEKVAFIKEFCLNLSRNLNYRRHFYGSVPAGVGTPIVDNTGQTQYPCAEMAVVDNTTEESVG
jgi:hypothetical protein